MTRKTREPQYQAALDLNEQQGVPRFGLHSGFAWHTDPKRLTFMLSRYKFVAKMLTGKRKVLEVGCGDAFASRIVRQEVGHLTVIDFDPVFIESAKEIMDRKWPIDVKVHDMLAEPVDGHFDGVYSLDTLEHIEPEKERIFLNNILASLTKDGVLIVGVPSIESQVYASKSSRAGHVNCKDGPGLRSLLLGYFANTFIFSMNDEVVHTGFTPMAHYLFALCTGKRD